MDHSPLDLYLGLDVQIRRACAYFVLDQKLAYVASGWLAGNTPSEICRALRAILQALSPSSRHRIAIGIDAPRQALTAPRQWYWNGKGWEAKQPGEKGFGRHCEVVIKALRIANPQWTRPQESAPPWMQLGFALFQALDDYEYLYEVFPSASYALLADQPQAQTMISFAHFAGGPKDMLDACISAFSVHEFLQGRGCEVGGGDSLGSIVLPTALPVHTDHPVLHWPHGGEKNEHPI